MIAIAERGAMCNPRDVFYMDKIVVGAAAADIIDINAPVERNIRAVASVLHMSRQCPPHEQRGRHCLHPEPPPPHRAHPTSPVNGSRIKFISDGDAAGAIMAASPDTGVDIALGVGGTQRASSQPVYYAPSAEPSRPSCGSQTTSRDNAPSMPSATSTRC
jgi:fructose-1,6-bisphosphatase II